MRCQRCGKVIDDNVKECPVCGAPVVLSGQTTGNDAQRFDDEPIRYTHKHGDSGYGDEPLPSIHKPQQTHKGKGKLIAAAAVIGVIAAAAITIPFVVNKDVKSEDSSSEHSTEVTSSEAEEAVTTTQTVTKQTVTTTERQRVRIVDLYELDGHYYKAFNNPDKMDFDKSQAACRKMGGHLVSINSQAEQDLIMNMIGNKDNYWIGLMRIATTWQWVDASNTEYTNWDMWVNDNGEECRQPDNYENREDVARIAGNSVVYDEWKMNKGGWLDTNRYGEGEDLSTYGYICEWNSKPDESKITEE